MGTEGIVEKMGVLGRIRLEIEVLKSQQQCIQDKLTQKGVAERAVAEGLGNDVLRTHCEAIGKVCRAILGEEESPAQELAQRVAFDGAYVFPQKASDEWFIGAMNRLVPAARAVFVVDCSKDGNLRYSLRLVNLPNEGSLRKAILAYAEAQIRLLETRAGIRITCNI